MIILALGSNLHSKFGNRYDNIEKTIYFLKKEGFKIFKKSSYYETVSFPNSKNPKFLNIVISINPILTPKVLMNKLLKIEKKMGRRHTKKNNPRICDIDIIDFNKKIYNIKLNGEKLIIPHKYMHKREFVLVPLSEIYPYWKHPVTGIKIKDLINKFGRDKIKSVTKISFA